MEGDRGIMCTFMAAGSSERSWKPAMLRREKIRATSCSENLHAVHKLQKGVAFVFLEHDILAPSESASGSNLDGFAGDHRHTCSWEL